MKIKTILIFAIGLFFTINSCKKNNGTDPIQPNSMSATVDGANMNFNINAKATLYKSSNSFIIIGETAASGVRVVFQINVFPNNATLIGTYLASDPANSTGFADLLYTYIFADTGNQFYTSNLANGTNASVTISSISETSIQGTFSGTLEFNGPSSATHSITNGKFNVPVVTN